MSELNSCPKCGLFNYACKCEKTQEQQPSQEPTEDDERQCPLCQIGVMELVDQHYNLELEAEYGVPVQVVTYVCSHCNFEEHEEGYEG